MKITECLSIEHRVLLRQIDRLEEAQGQNASIEQRQAMLALLAAGLEEHAAIEDELLFPALEPHLGRQAGPLAVMDMEHEEIRSLLSQAEEDEGDIAGIIASFIAVARDHFAKENQVLFPMAERLLEEGELLALGGAYIDRPAHANEPGTGR